MAIRGSRHTYTGTVALRDVAALEASFIVPNDAKPGDTIHVVCEVTDDGTPSLTRYRRVVVTVSGE